MTTTPVPPQGTTIIVGSSEAGKTTMLASAIAAWRPPGRKRGHDLKLFLDTSYAQGLLARAVVDLLRTATTRPDAGIQKTDGRTDYHVVVRATPVGAPSSAYDHALRIVDTPGEHVVGNDTAKRNTYGPQLHEAAKGAGTLILCVDLTRPDSEALFVGLCELIAGSATHSPAPPPSSRGLASIAARWFGQELPVGADQDQRWLPFERVLVVLTKVDEYAAQDPRVPARDRALQLNPIHCAVQAIGHPLYWLRQNLRPRAELAVVLSSAWGFDGRTGRPYAHVAREWAEAYPDHPAVRDRVIRDWKPFGVRSALVYATTGRVEGRVRRILPQHLRMLRG